VTVLTHGIAQMPTANVRTLEEGEEITEISMIVSEKLVPGVLGQLRIKTTENGADGYKFGRTTDGEELRIVTPPGMRLVSTPALADCPERKAVSLTAFHSPFANVDAMMTDVAEDRR
jgi:hypothetical protein